LENIEATDFNFGVMILTSSCYTCKEFYTTPTSGLGGASVWVDRVQKSSFYASLCRFTVQYGRLILASKHWICEGEGLNCLQTKWEAWGSYGLGMVTAWKTAKKLCFAWYGPFSYILYHIWIFCLGTGVL